MYALAVAGTGVSQVVWALRRSEYGMTTCAAAFGFCVVAMGPVWSEMTFLIAGPELFALAIGYTSVVMGVGWMAGVPAAGRPKNVMQVPLLSAREQIQTLSKLNISCYTVSLIFSCTIFHSIV